MMRKTRFDDAPPEEIPTEDERRSAWHEVVPKGILLAEVLPSDDNFYISPFSVPGAGHVQRTNFNPSDAAWAKMDVQGGPSCTCTAFPCEHLCRRNARNEPKPYQRAVFFHSVANFSPDTVYAIANVTDTKCAYAVEFDTFESSGVCGAGKCHYRISIDDDGVPVVTSTVGNVYASRSPMAMWLRQGGVNTVHGPLSVSAARSQNGVTLYVMTPCERRITPQQPHNILEATRDQSWYGDATPVFNRANNDDKAHIPITTAERLRATRIFSCGPLYLVATESKTTVHVPKEVIGRVAASVVAGEHSPNLYQSCAKMCETAISKLNMPPTDMPLAVLYCTVAAFHEVLPYEIDLMDREVRPRLGEYAVHSRMVRSFIFPSSWNPTWFFRRHPLLSVAVATCLFTILLMTLFTTTPETSNLQPYLPFLRLTKIWHKNEWMFPPLPNQFEHAAAWARATITSPFRLAANMYSYIEAEAASWWAWATISAPTLSLAATFHMPWWHSVPAPYQLMYARIVSLYSGDDVPPGPRVNSDKACVPLACEDNIDYDRFKRNRDVGKRSIDYSALKYPRLEPNKHSYSYCYGPGFRGYAPLVFLSNASNELTGILNRVMIPYSYRERTLRDEARFIDDNFDKLNPGWREHAPIDATPFPEWARKYNKNMREILRAADEMLHDGQVPRGMFTRSFFCKVECGATAGPWGGKDADPRIISSSKPALNVSTGRWVHAYAKAKAKIWHFEHIIGLSSGRSAEEHGAWAARHNSSTTVWVEVDCSRYDASMSPEHQRMEQSWFARFGSKRWRVNGALGSIADVLRRTILNRGRSHHGVRASVFGSRASGLSNTSISNSEHNAYAHVYAHCVVNNCTVDDLLHPTRPEHQFHILVCGDDSIIATHYKANTNYGPVLRELGLRPTITVHRNLWDASYCSSLFWPTADGIVLGPKVGRQIVKFGWSSHWQPDGKAWCKAKATCMYRDASFVPVLSEFLQAVIDKTRSAKTITYRYENVEKVRARQLHTPNDTTRAMFRMRYGVEPNPVHVPEPGKFSNSDITWLVRRDNDFTSYGFPQSVGRAVCHTLGFKSTVRAFVITRDTLFAVIEEWIYHQWPEVRLLVAPVEMMFMAFDVETTPQRKSAVTISLLLQLMFHFLPFPYAVVSHALWNVFINVAITANVQQPRTWFADPCDLLMDTIEGLPRVAGM